MTFRRKTLFASSLLLMAFLFAAKAADGQSLQDFTWLGDDYYGEIYLGVGFKHTRTANPGAPREEKHRQSGNTGDFHLRVVNDGAGEVRYTFQNKLFSDLVFILDNMVNEDGSRYYRQEASGLTGGPIGWHSFGANIIATDRLIVGGGANFNDYFFATSYWNTDSVPSGVLVSQEPQGWYIGPGPMLFADVLLTDFLVLHLQADYNFPLWRPVDLTYAEADPEYPYPRFFHCHAELVSKCGVFAMADYVRVNNRGDLHNETRRFDVLIGFRFAL